MYHGVSGVFCVYDITNKESFTKLESWIKGTRRYAPGEEVVVSIVGNKTDLSTQRVVTEAQGQKFASDNGLRYYETSALTGDNVMQAFEQLISDILNAHNNSRKRQSGGGGCGCTLL